MWDNLMQKMAVNTVTDTGVLLVHVVENAVGESQTIKCVICIFMLAITVLLEHILWFILAVLHRCCFLSSVVPC